MISSPQRNMVDENVRVFRRVHVRMGVVAILMGLGFLIVTYRATTLQVMHNTSLENVANRQYRAVVPVSVRRGSILDAKGTELVTSVPVQSLYADPAMIDSPDAVIRQLSSVIRIKSPSQLLAKLSSQKRFVWIERRLDADVVKKIKALDLDGIYFVEESKRVYPYGELASHVLGAVGIDSTPLGGAELKYDDYLKSRHQRVYYQRDAKGRFYFSPTSYEDQNDVGTVVLTIDKNIQFFAEQALKEAVIKHGAKSGVVAVMDVRDGAVLAMTSSPTYDPNRFNQYQHEAWRNRVVTDMFEPGSTFKVLVVSKALDEGVVKASQVFDCEHGKRVIGSATINDHHPYDKLTVTDIIKVSSNIGTSKIGDEMGASMIYESVKSFGIGSKLGIDYPGEASGQLRSAKGWTKIDQATITFGQGVSTTPLQMLAAYSAIANGGTLYQPYLVRYVKGAQGENVYAHEPVVLSHPLKSETAALVRNILEGVVQEGGTGTLAASTEYRMAGKTGTAQKVDESGRYADGKYFASFVGFAPADQPRIAVFVGLDEPHSGSYYGGTVAGPSFRRVAESTLKYLEVPSNNVRIVMPTERGEKKSNVADRVSRSIPSFSVNGDWVSVPSLVGLTMRDVVDAVSESPVTLAVRGMGVVASQQPEAGSRVKTGSAVTVKLEMPN